MNFLGLHCPRDKDQVCRLLLLPLLNKTVEELLLNLVEVTEFLLSREGWGRKKQGGDGEDENRAFLLQK